MEQKLIKKSRCPISEISLHVKANFSDKKYVSRALKTPTFRTKNHDSRALKTQVSMQKEHKIGRLLFLIISMSSILWLLIIQLNYFCLLQSLATHYSIYFLTKLLDNILKIRKNSDLQTDLLAFFKFA